MGGPTLIGKQKRKNQQEHHRHVFPIHFTQQHKRIFSYTIHPRAEESFRVKNDDEEDFDKIISVGRRNPQRVCDI